MNNVNPNSLTIIPYMNPGHVIGGYFSKIQHILNDSFKAQFADYTYFSHYGMGDIVVLVGTSTAGKSSIIKALKHLELDRLEDGGDLRCWSLDLKILEGYCPKEIEILKNLMNGASAISNAVFGLERFWKKGISFQESEQGEEIIQKIKMKMDSLSPDEMEEINALFQSAEEKMIDDALEYSRRGGNIIFDVLNIDVLARRLLTRNFKGPLRAILTYCPFHVLSSRMEVRNREALESGELGNQRNGAFPFLQFGDIYSQKESEQDTLECITREQAITAFDINFDRGVEADLKRGRKLPSFEELQLMKNKKRDDLLKNLGFSEKMDVVEIAPKDQDFYYCLINTSRQLPEESAQRIHEGTSLRYQKKVE